MSDPITPTPVPVDPTNDKLYALITAVVTTVIAAIVAFLHITGEQKAAIMAATIPCGGLVAYLFISSHKANVQASATMRAAHMTAMMFRRVS